MLPPSASSLAKYVDPAEEAALLARIDDQRWRNDLRRRVQHYGYLYDYKARRVSAETYLGPLPDWLSMIARRLHEDGLFQSAPDQVIVNEYQPGQGIASHVDCEPCFGDTIASLSLGSACLMEFHDMSSSEVLDHFLEPGTLLVLKDEARFGWKHGIPARKSDVINGVRVARKRRVSLTFRTVLLDD